MPGLWGVSPKESIRAECERRGREEVGRGCIGILRGSPSDYQLLSALAGPAAQQVLDGREGGVAGYWPRVWATRGLLHAWDDSATEALLVAATDESWRVREMAAKVVAAHRIDEALDAVVALEQDPVARVRSAASRAVRALVVQGG